ncbi:MAG: hypothetical protein FWH07_01235 [Oscillospiraceae bacterium]|nr:hypothetical protein [Oscillospiraceae bacterium]
MKNNISLLYYEGYKKGRRQDLPQDYIANLELKYIASVISPHHQEYTLNLLCENNTDSELILYRQDILQDFINNPKLEHTLQETIQKLFFSFKTVGRNYGSTHSFFELNENLKILKSYIYSIEKLHEIYNTSYTTLKSTGLKKLMDLFEETYHSKNFIKVRHEVDYLRQALANGIKSITVAINLDDEMNPVQAVLLSTNRKHYREKGLFDSFMNKEVPENITTNSLTSMYDRNGALDYTNKKIFDEINKISCDYRKRMNVALVSFAKSNAEYVMDLAPQIDFYSGARKLIELMANRGLTMCRPEIAPIDERVTLLNETYDLVFAHKYKPGKSEDKIVTNTCEMDNEGRIFILTGPNNGGKTTYVRGIGICNILAQAGLHVPAKTARISPVDYIFTHFPKEEEVGVNTSRFTNECKDLKNTAENATKYSLLLLNESISSTTPTECLYVAQEMMKIFCYIGVRGLFATHMLDLAYQSNEINLEVKGESKLGSITVGRDENGERDYKVVKGLPQKSSYAIDIFDKYGINYAMYTKKKKKT